MDLHTAKRPDWAGIDYEQMNIWQKAADKTDGWVTPANFVSGVGTATVLVGLMEVARGDYPMGIGLIALGRSMDVVDGVVADKTGTKSPKGELVDAGVDKIQAAAAIVSLWSVGAIEELPAASFAAINAANVVLTGIAKVRGTEIHPSRSGKLFTATMWGSIVSSTTALALNSGGNHGAANWAEVSGYALAVLSTVLGVKAAAGYRNDAFAPAINS